MAMPNSCPKCGAGSRDLYLVAALFWVVSLARVLVALAEHEVFAVEASLASIFVIVVPWALTPRLRTTTGIRVR
jgi:hypothetical protein